MSNSPLSQGELKSLFLIALREFGGNIKKSCQAAQIARKTYYNWCEKDEDFEVRAKLIAMECTEELLDDAEDVLRFALLDPKQDSKIARWLLARLGKQRGYGSKVTVEHTGADFTKNDYPDEPESAEEWEAEKEMRQTASEED